MKKVKLSIIVLVIIIIITVIVIETYPFIVTPNSCGYNGKGITTPGGAIRVACLEWNMQNYPDAKQIKVECWDADDDGLRDPGISCIQDNLETLGQKFYDTGTCEIGIGASEQNLKRVCGFSS